MGAHEATEARPEAGGPGGDRLAAGEAPQVGGEVAGRGVPPGRILVEALQADCFDVAGDAGGEAARGRRVVLDDLAERGEVAVAPEGRPAGEQLVEDRAEAV